MGFTKRNLFRDTIINIKLKIMNIYILLTLFNESLNTNKKELYVKVKRERENQPVMLCMMKCNHFIVEENSNKVATQIIMLKL